MDQRSNAGQLVLRDELCVLLYHPLQKVEFVVGAIQFSAPVSNISFCRSP